MNKRNIIITLIITAVLGSVVTFYASNMFFSDVSNFGAGFMNTTLFASLTAMLFGAIILMIPLYVLRLYKRPNTKKRLTSTYLFTVMGLALFGIVFAVLAGVLNYHSFIKPYPFPGFLIIAMIFHALILAGACVAYFLLVKKMPEDEEKFKVTFLHVLHTIGLYALIALAFNRFGAFLFMPVYIQWSNFYMTFVYFLFLLLPMALLVIKTLRVLEFEKSLFIPSLVIGILTVVLFAVIAILGVNDSAFISAVSAAAPLERLGSMPMEILIHLVVILGVDIYYIIVEKRRKN